MPLPNVSPEPAQEPSVDRPALSASRLPRWPLVTMFGFYPVWWTLGVVDMLWIPFAGVLALYLFRRSALRAPRGFGLWLFFLVWMSFSVIMLDSFTRVIGFGYRWSLYLAFTVLFLYVYNARGHIKARFFTGLLALFWVYVVVGGYLGVLFPTTVIRTPMSQVLPQSLLGNELVNQMVVRRFAQFNPKAYFYIDPRPSAPFLYTNNWGNAYSLLAPIVITHLALSRRRRHFWPLLIVLPVSLVPAFLTLNRGMFLGLGLAVVYATIRLALVRRTKALAALVTLGVLAAGAFVVLPVQDRLENRLESSSTTEDRASLYVDAWSATQESPLFGYGAPRPADSSSAPSVGTQGQFWLILYSHGVPALIAFLGWFIAAVVGSLRRLDPIGLACNTVLVVGIVELAYYGLLPQGLPILMIAAGLALRGPDPVEPAIDRRSLQPAHIGSPGT